jgi:predicted nucleic acid-binding Zn ribbon protein
VVGIYEAKAKKGRDFGDRIRRNAGVPAMFCPKCGKEIPDGSGFCSKCGSALTDSSKKAEIEKAPRNWVLYLSLLALTVVAIAYWFTRPH